jgi:hypothetical protein
MGHVCFPAMINESPREVKQPPRQVKSQGCLLLAIDVAYCDVHNEATLRSRHHLVCDCAGMLHYDYSSYVHSSLWLYTLVRHGSLHFQLPSYATTYASFCMNIHNNVPVLINTGPASGSPHLVVLNTCHSLMKCPKAQTYAHIAN